MKHNFVLTPSNCNIFIQRFNKLMSKTGALESKGKWNGRKALASVLSKDSFSHMNIVETCTTFFLQRTVKFDSYPSGMKIGQGRGIIIRPNSDCAHVFVWGQKFKFTPTQIKTVGDKDKASYQDSGLTETFNVCHRIGYAQGENEFIERTSKAYWRDQEREYAGDLDGEDYFDL